MNVNVIPNDIQNPRTVDRCELHQGDVYKDGKGRLLMHTSKSDGDYRAIVLQGAGTSVVGHDAYKEVQLVGKASITVNLL